MTHPKHPINQHYHSAKEHLAGVRAARRWRQELIDAHLLDTQQPIKDQPVTPTPPGTP